MTIEGFVTVVVVIVIVKVIASSVVCAVTVTVVLLQSFVSLFYFLITFWFTPFWCLRVPFCLLYRDRGSDDCPALDDTGSCREYVR